MWAAPQSSPCSRNARSASSRAVTARSRSSSCSEANPVIPSAYASARVSPTFRESSTPSSESAISRSLSAEPYTQLIRPQRALARIPAGRPSRASVCSISSRPSVCRARITQYMPSAQPMRAAAGASFASSDQPMAALRLSFSASRRSSHST